MPKVWTSRREGRPRPLAGVAALIAMTLPAGALLAQEQASRWSVTASAVWMSPAGDEAAAEGRVQRVDEDGSGFGLGLEWRATPRFGFELGVMIVDLDTELRVDSDGPPIADTQTLGLESVFVGADWHPAPRAAVDWSLGAFVAQTMFDDVIFVTEAGGREKRTADDDHGFGVKLGLEWPGARRGRWFAAADLRYMVTILESEIAGRDIDLDPMTVTVGVGARF